jgi:hypothetical protein
VAIAEKPRPARTRADPASQALDDERARPLMERAERIAFVELSDGHNVFFLR